MHIGIYLEHRAILLGALYILSGTYLGRVFQKHYGIILLGRKWVMPMRVVVVVVAVAVVVDYGT
jgi:hypothetical protein